MRALLLALWVLLAGALPLAAQDQASLVADRVAITGRDVLVAEGGVEVFYQGRRLRASRISYDRAADRLTIEGPIVLSDGSGSFILADQADLSADLTEGVLRSARLVLNRQLQLAASEVQRIGNRYTRLGRTVASSCRICNGDGAPVWEIRARRVVHDTEERQIYFDRAELRLLGVPVALIPRLRMPDPTLKRATGFLMPELRSSNILGTGLRLPYFIRIGDHRDLTLVPFVTNGGGRTLDLRYRQAFRTGQIELSGAVSRDRIRPGETRFYGVLTGRFALPDDFVLDLQAETVSDRGYLLDYDLSERDRLFSEVAISRARRDEWISGRIAHQQTLRAGESNVRLPSILGDFTWTRRAPVPGLGGIATLTFQTHSHYRSSDETADLDGDGIADGRDVARATLRAGWRRELVFGPGLQAVALAEAQGDIYRVRQDFAAGGRFARSTAGAGIELRWPWVRAETGGATQVIEPVAQVVWSTPRPGAVPNEDSLLSEFDEGNLFDTRRFPGNDAVERGRRTTLGLTWTRISASGATVSLGFGRILRDHDETGFSAASGMAGRQSDLLAVLRYAPRPGFDLTARAAIDKGSTLTKGEVRLDLDRRRYALASSYVWLRADPAEGRLAQVSELLFDGRYDVTEAWTARLAGRYDLASGRAASAKLGIGWRNECLKVDLSLSRRFTSSTSVAPRTDVGLSVELLGFGGASAPGPARACRG
ncbi:MAG TPA: LPS assembly protein LptD [Paracoccaceae bacterium]|nr:LPS assembly protein LptD [Paracoccaceae bacterium]